MRTVATVATLAITACGLAVLASAGATRRSDRSLEATAQVRELAAGEYRGEVVFAPGCGAPRLWMPSKRSTRPLDVARRCFRRNGVYGLSHAGRIISWGSHDGDTSSFWLAIRALDSGRLLRRARRVARVRADRGTNRHLLLGEGRASYSTYAIGRTIYLASQDAQDGKPFKRRVVELSTRPLWLSRTGAGGMVAVQSADGRVLLLGESQADVRRTYAYEAGVVRAAKLYGSRLVVLRDGKLDWHEYVPARTRTLRLPRARSYGDGFCGRPRCTRAQLRLEDLHRDLVVYVLRRQIHVLRLTDGKDVVVRAPRGGPVEAQIEDNGLSYSAGRRVAFVPMRRVTTLLNER